MLTHARIASAAVITLALAALAFAAVPQTINYQGYLKDAVTGAPATGPINITFQLYSTTTGTTSYWSEQKKVEPANGVYSVELGEDKSNGLDARHFNGPVYLGVQVESDPEMIPRQALTSTPFAIRAGMADSVAVDSVSDAGITGQISSGKLDLSGVVNKTGDTMTGALILPSNGLTVGNNELVVSGGKVGVGALPTGSTKFQIINSTISGSAGLVQINNTLNSLPALYGSTNGSGAAVFGYNNGTGRAGHFQISKLTSTASALVAETNGTGYAAEIRGNMQVTGDVSAGTVTLPANSLTIGTDQLVLSGNMVAIGGPPSGAAKFQVYNTATSGQAALFKINNAGNPLPAVYGTTNGLGQAVYGLNDGLGRAGHFVILNPASSASALVAETNGTGHAGEFLGSMRVTGPITSTVATGTAPITVASTTQVTNLNANLLNGMQASEIITAASDEVRTPISACGTTITTSGSYYVTQNLSTTGGCITVNTSNVTIDLMGFALTGDGAGIEPGISIGSTRNNVEIRNGTVRNFYNGIVSISTTANSNRIINVHAVSNAGYGIYLLSNGSLVKDCAAADNGGVGISVGAGSLVINSTTYNNALGLVVTNSGTTISGNTAYANLGTGIVIHGTATVTNNTVHGNGEWGIDTDGIAGSSGTRIVGNTISYNNTSNTASVGGLNVNYNSMVKDNILIGNLQNNIYVAGQRNMIEENLVNGSTNGIFFNLSLNYFANNRASDNTTDFNIRAGQIVINGGGNVSF